VVERLAVLIGAGVSPATAWTYAAEGTDDPVLAAIARRIDRGAGVADAVAMASAERGSSGRWGANAAGADAAGRRVGSGSGVGTGAASTRGVGVGGGGARGGGEGDPWSVLAVAWFVASEAGAPLARCLSDIADSLRAVGAVERETAAALAGPAATTRLVAVLPLISLASGWLLGLDTGAALLGSPAGIACLASGLILMAAGRFWSGALLRRARRIDPVPGLSLDLVAVAVAGGGSLPQARSLVGETMSRFGLDAGRDAAAVHSVLTLAARSGAPPGELLRNEAARLRRDSVGEATARAAALGTWLMLPLGVCVLPAFMLLAVAPVLIGVLSSTDLA
jgi:tight adherence protein B